MVNYCCVASCGRNSRTHSYLNFYSVPKEKERRTEWLKRASREDLLSTLDDKQLSTRRVCSRHFAQDCLKNKHLTPEAVPTLFLDGGSDDDDAQEFNHPGIACDNCTNLIFGYRYKCVTCTDYDLCQKCEMARVHPAHYMIRFPKPVLMGNAQTLTRTWKDFAKKITNITGEAEYIDSDSSDDVPITQYKRRHDAELTEAVKAKIRKEVNRVLDTKIEEWPTELKVAQNAHVATWPALVSEGATHEGAVDDYMHQVEFADVEDPEKFEGNGEAKIEVSSAAVQQTQTSGFINDALSEFLIKKS